jgi:hypothetical protein
MQSEFESRAWCDFLKIKSANCDLTNTERRIFLNRFPTPVELEFNIRTHESVANIVCAHNEDPVGSCRGHLRNIYRKIGLGPDSQADDNRKAQQAFTKLMAEFQEWKFSLQLQNQFRSQDDAVAKQLNDLLLNLNFRTEEAAFHERIDCLNKVGVFFAEINNHHAQAWLSHRLMKNNPVLKTAHGRSIRVTSSWRGEVDEFWRWIAKDTNYDYSKQHTILIQLCEQIREQSVFLAIYDVDKLRKTDLREILTNFWLPLQTMIQEQSYLDGKDCVILFVGKIGWIEKMQDCLLIDNITNASLPVWGEVNAKHIESWLKPEEVRNFCERHSGKDYSQVLDFFDIDQDKLNCNALLEEPYQVLDNICGLLKLTNGIAELEPYWKIAS